MPPDYLILMIVALRAAFVRNRGVIELEVLD
jgi:hypothetical protein